MQRIRQVLKKAFTPITIMFVPHTNARSVSVKVPSVGIVVSVVLWLIGTVYVFSVAINAMEYHKMKERMDYYSGQFLEMRSTVAALNRAESEFRRLFSLKSKDEVLERVDTSDNGSIDLDALKEQIKTSMETVGEIREYLREERDVYMSTPKGLPVEGKVSSPYGHRAHPKSGKRDFHSGLDIAADSGHPVRSTADGIVSFAGWSGGSGNLVAIEHGFGFSTLYAHNRSLTVKVGQRVRRGDVIGHVGSTGNSTGPHVHYEVWKEGKAVDPNKFADRRS